ncbi:MAG: DUF1036 domain-containing protein [Candidatus Cloacimonetes bacterium]|nr:DUF1036 domain-containing protein [Candidatus Cloacimonadota bacterium]
MFKQNFIRIFSLSVLIIYSLLFSFPSKAHAWLKVYNKTGKKIYVAVGQVVGDDWKTEGWWEISNNKSAIVVGGNRLPNDYYYLYAEYEDGGSIRGDGYYFSITTQGSQFTIKAADDYDKCLSSDFQWKDFRELNVGSDNMVYTFD